ncbi:DUF1501 domain-containing protein [Planctomyces sp. SH-PL14]|uniref:DUF1501 domain-containing protein n=1 Tax=Planctomyces sp. SH-PL14 TaxID=1632864 RepID=UPI00078C78D6|nr:DUF1501 domain-containing protein [Planctomyces sp. SH-PL14]AMV17469.1 hypothetical protein VT03_06230 [Planctomyces sp. SH-PL14]
MESSAAPLASSLPPVPPSTSSALAGLKSPLESPITVQSRRWFLKAGLAGLGGLMSPSLLRAGTEAAATKPNSKKSVILIWLSGGPSHIDMWDPKPEAPTEIRGPYSPIATKLPGVQFCEHLPLQASILDKMSVLRGVDCQSSNHTPITFQAGNPLARRTDDGKDGAGWPSMGSVAAKFRGSNHPDMPAFVGLAPSWVADVYESGDMGAQFSAIKGLDVVGKFALPKGIEASRLEDRESLRQSFDRLRQDLDQKATLEKLDRYTQQAYSMVLGGHVQRAFDLNKESDETRLKYGKNEIGEKVLLARRLVEAGVSYTTVSAKWGYFDHHGDNVQWGGIEKGLTPILPTVDRAMFALVNDLEERGLLDDTLVLMLGEFGRAPVINKEAGRDHWTSVMSMLVAGGGLRHGQVIGSTDSKGYGIQSGIVRPQDLAATVFRHLEIDLESQWTNLQGRPMPIIVEGGRPIPELV